MVVSAQLRDVLISHILFHEVELTVLLLRLKCALCDL